MATEVPRSLGLPDFLRELTYSARGFLRTPSLALALLLTIALGSGGALAIRGFTRGLTAPAEPPVALRGLVSMQGPKLGPLTGVELARLRKRRQGVGAARIVQATVRWPGHSGVFVVGEVTPELSRLLQIPVERGAVLSAQAPPFSERIELDGVEFPVAGRTPVWLEGLYRDQPVDLWIALSSEGLERAGRNLWVLARPLAGDGSEWRPYTGVNPARQERLARVALPLNLAAGVLLVIACGNVAAFLLGRAAARSSEFSLRVALGANWVRLARQMAADSVVISLVGGAGGVVLAGWMQRILPTLLFEQDAERVAFVGEGRATLAAAGVCVGLTLLCGLLPILTATRHQPAAVLRRESAGPSRVRRRLRNLLVVGQMALCSLLILTTAFLINGLNAALRTGVGRQVGDAVLVTMQASPRAGLRYFRNAEEAAQVMGGFQVGAWAGRLPGGLPTWRTFRVDPVGAAPRTVTMDVEGPPAERISLKTGRRFGYETRSCASAIVNEAAAALLFGPKSAGRLVEDPSRQLMEIIGIAAGRGRPAIYYWPEQRGGAVQTLSGARFRVGAASRLAEAELDANVVSTLYFDWMGMTLAAGRSFGASGCRQAMVNQEAAERYFAGEAVGAAVIDEAGRRSEIVGVVRSVALGSFQRQVEPAIYFPMEQDALPVMTLILSGRRVDDALLEEVRRRVEDVPGRGPAPLGVKSLEAHLRQTALAPQRIATVILGAAAAVGLLLCGLGLYGALSDAARERRRQIAIRLALGARRRDMVALVVGEGLRVALAATGVSLLGSAALPGLLERVAPGGAAPAAWVWLMAPLALVVAVMLASLGPARRSIGVDPISILRQDP